ncbi:COP9 signalosome complex subunit 4 [Sarcoptes scabiei]|nr:COP9 signalosome complex subunit 4 [Sarcoptes scabiei]
MSSIIQSTESNINIIRTANDQPILTSTASKNLCVKPSTSSTFLVAHPCTNPSSISNNENPTSFSSPAIVATNSNNQQQLIILSPLKPNPSAKTSFIPSINLMPHTKIQQISPTKTSKRLIAPAPITKTITALRSVPSTSGKADHFISLIPINNNNSLNFQSNIATKYIPLKPSTASKPIGTSIAAIKPNMVHLTSKVLVNPNTIKISNTVASTVGPTSPVVSNSNIITNKTQPTSIWMVPQQIIKLNDNTSSSLAVTKQTGKYVPIAPNPNQSNANVQEVQKINVNTSNVKSSNDLEESRRKACNCTRSQCLKLYCDCFANGEFCSNCNCVSCYNNLEHEEIRQKAIRLCLERNPNAFHPKIGQTQQGEIERRHTKGCCCKRSGCLKNYCECYEAKILCTDKCKCVGCKNYEESAERKTLMHLADAAEVRSAQQSMITSKMNLWGPPFKSKLPVKVKSDCHPFNILTTDILEATANCMLAQAEEGEFENFSEENIQALILDQFGECLSQILNLASNGISEELELFKIHNEETLFY